MKKRILSVLFLISLCSFMLAGCASSAPTSEPENTETTIAVEPETTPTPEVEPETTEETKETEAVETETVETTETETEIQTEEAETEESSTYTFTDMDAIKYAKSSVNVRSLPDTSGDKLGGLSTNDEVHITGQCNETGWFRFEYNGSVAYVSNSYLVDEKVAVEQAPAQNASNEGDQSSGNNCPYTLWEVTDNGNSMSWYVIQPDPNWNVHAPISENMQATIRNRAPNGWFDQTEWTYIGTYAEGKVYRQTFGVLDYCPW